MYTVISWSRKFYLSNFIYNHSRLAIILPTQRSLIHGAAKSFYFTLDAVSSPTLRHKSGGEVYFSDCYNLKFFLI